MRVLLDEQLPRVQQGGWAGLKNGMLLNKAEAAGFTVFVTGDQNLEHQQNLMKRKLGVVLLSAASNTLEDLLPLMARTLVAIDWVNPGQLIRVAA